MSFVFVFQPKMNVHFRSRFVIGRKWNFVFVGIFVYGWKRKMLFGRPLIGLYITKRSWSWSWDAKTWSWSWTLGLVLVLKLRSWSWSWSWKKSWLHHCCAQNNWNKKVSYHKQIARQNSTTFWTSHDGACSTVYNFSSHHHRVKVFRITSSIIR